MKTKDGIELSKEVEAGMISAIKKYFAEERDEDLGDLASALILDFVTKELAPEFYNQGVYDSYAYMSERCDDLLSIQKK